MATSSTPTSGIDTDVHTDPLWDTATEERLHRKMSRKVKFVFIVCLCGFLAIAARLFIIQVLQADAYREMARRQYESKIRLAAERGNIYDRKRRLVATTVEKLSIAVDPRMLQNAGHVCSVLSSVTGRPAEEYMAKIRAEKGAFVWLERTIDSPASVLTSQLDSLTDDGLIKIREPRRSFAYGSLASQILGFTDAENKGASGIELAWDSLMAGRSGFMYLQRDGRGKKRTSPDQPALQPQAGKSLVLTIDMDMQSIAESELQQGVQAAAAESGAVIIIQPSTGAVLAMASSPTFNPNQLSGATADLTRNRCVTDMYEPGSTFKLVTAAALINEGRITPETPVNANPDQLPRGVNIKDEHPLEIVPFYRSMEMSSNIVMATLAQRIPSPKFYKYVRDFGFGIYTGIDLPGEVRGIVKRPHEFDATTKMYMAHGYELAATPLQIVNAYAAVANQGIMMRPYLVQSVVESDGTEVQNFQPQKIRTVITPETAQKLTTMFCGVVERGTGSSARIQGLSIAGKTGTAQKLRDGRYSKVDYTASFAGFFPAEKPEVAMLVMLHNPRNGIYGSQVSAPIFQKIAQKLVSSGLVSTGGSSATLPVAASGDAPSVSSSPSSPNATSNSALNSSSNSSPPVASGASSAAAQQNQQPAIVPDLRGLPYNDALETAKDAGYTLKANVVGGVIQDQKPKAGSPLAFGGTITATTTQPDITVDALPNKNIPSVQGMTLRRALTLLHAANIKTKVIGQGSIIVRQEFKDGREPVCTLYCSDTALQQANTPSQTLQSSQSSQKGEKKHEKENSKQGQKKNDKQHNNSHDRH
jgi:cell division protein FtsI (penicillin-binding protein 3)